MGRQGRDLDRRASARAPVAARACTPVEIPPLPPHCLRTPGINPRPPSALVALIDAMLNAFHRLFGSNEKETPECA